jgi:hypothetical protein
MMAAQTSETIDLKYGDCFYCNAFGKIVDNQREVTGDRMN